MNRSRCQSCLISCSSLSAILATEARNIHHHSHVNARRNWAGLAIADGKGVRAHENGGVCFAHELRAKCTPPFSLGAGFCRRVCGKIASGRQRSWLERSHAHPSREQSQSGPVPTFGLTTIFILADDLIESFNTYADGQRLDSVSELWAQNKNVHSRGYDVKLVQY
jgi:hypothetical protein